MQMTRGFIFTDCGTIYGGEEEQIEKVPFSRGKCSLIGAK